MYVACYLVNVTLSDLIHTGWPEKIRDIPKEVREFWSYRAELSIQNGIILKGIKWSYRHHCALISCSNSTHHIRASKRPRSLHVNLSIGLACQNLSRTHVPAVLNAKRCNTSSHLNSSSPTSDPYHPGSRSELIYSASGMNIISYYSRYPIVKKLPSLNASATINATKKHSASLVPP